MLFEEGRDKANGMVGATQGIMFSLTSVFSGIVIGFFGMSHALLLALGATLLVLIHTFTLHIDEKEIVHVEGIGAKVDFAGTLAVVLAIPGLLALIFFQTFNNFLGGVFMALMDAYGLSLVSVQVWGVMWGVVSFAMIAGSMYVAKRGVGKHPLRTILIINLISWGTCIIFPLAPSIVLLSVGMIVWMLLMPIAEAAEQTVIQNIVPFERQGRVFGFAQSIESMASPVTTFLIGPVAQFIFIPFMTTGAGVALIGDWFGTGQDRGIALVFICAGLMGVIVTTLAFYSKAYRLLSEHYAKEKPAS
jgi:DHA3 family multidrug efflux protein-like MFS transporter